MLCSQTIANMYKSLAVPYYVTTTLGLDMSYVIEADAHLPQTPHHKRLVRQTLHLVQGNEGGTEKGWVSQPHNRRS